MRSAGVSLLTLALAGLAGGCAAPSERTAETRLECEIDGYYYFVSHPWACLREGGRVTEVSAEPSPWVTEAVRVGWQGRDEITSGRVHYNRAGAAGGLRLELPEAGDVCEGSYTLYTRSDAEWQAACDSGRSIGANVFFNEGGVSISAQGKDGEGRTFGFFAKPGRG